MGPRDGLTGGSEGGSWAARDDHGPLLRNPVDHFINHFDEWMRLDPARDFSAEMFAVDDKRPTGRHAVKLPYLHHQ